MIWLSIITKKYLFKLFIELVHYYYYVLATSKSLLLLTINVTWINICIFFATRSLPHMNIKLYILWEVGVNLFSRLACNNSKQRGLHDMSLTSRNSCNQLLLFQDCKFIYREYAFSLHHNTRYEDSQASSSWKSSTKKKSPITFST